ncbi:hypothetical protein ACFSOZ_24285 [Mesorhizobium newzealandense]|uniref:Uncharacterized protein n=1 Tax=Mesorhizobium newzealandense TaxID=1300302 RepID=A0ABW4UIW2_9HYPH
MIRSELARILADEAGTPSLREFLDCFPCLREDTAALAMMVRNLERRERVMPSTSSLDEVDLLRAVADSVAWTEHLVLAFADLEEVPLRHPAAFAAASTASIRAAWGKHPSAAAYAALRLHRLLRFAIARDRTLECVEHDESFLRMLAGLPGSERILWLLDRVSELFIGVAMEKIAWIYLEGGAKGHWRWLVYGRLVTEPDIVDAFVRFTMGSLPRETYNDVEQLVVELLRDADRWATVDEISSTDGGIAMLRAGNLLRRRRLGCLKADYLIAGDDGKSGL